MTLSDLNFQKIAAVLICVTIIGFVLIAGRPIFVPLAFGLFLALMLMPFCSFWEGKGFGRPWAIGFTFLLVFLILGGITAIFSSQLVSVVSQLSGLEKKLTKLIGDGLIWIENNLSFNLDRNWIQDNLASFIQTPIEILGASIRSSTTLLANVILAIIYAVLFLLYRSSLKNFWVTQFTVAHRTTANDIIGQIQKVVQKYLQGLTMVIVILGAMNSLGLWLLGIDYPVFWGLLSAFLAIIPYVGTFIGAFLPFLYALVTTDTLWQPAGVAALFVFVQQIEGNIITPKLVGSNIKVNPLAAILSLIVGGYLWGISGLILALPVVAVLKITLDNIEVLKPWGALLSSELYEKEDIFHKQYNEGTHKIFKVFSKKPD